MNFILFFILITRFE